MSNSQKAGFCLFVGIVMLAGVAGGIETSPDLLSMDGVYLGVFALIGFAFMALGSSYANEDTKPVDNPTLW
jgi:hypothetical protein